MQHTPLLRGAQYPRTRLHLPDASAQHLAEAVASRQLEMFSGRSLWSAGTRIDADAMPYSPSYRYARLWHALSTQPSLTMPKPHRIFGVGLGGTSFCKPVLCTETLRTQMLERAAERPGILDRNREYLEQLPVGHPVSLRAFDYHARWSEYGQTPERISMSPEIAEAALLFGQTSPAEIRFVDLDPLALALGQAQLGSTHYVADNMAHVQQRIPELVKQATRGDLERRAELKAEYATAFGWLDSVLAPMREQRFDYAASYPATQFRRFREPAQYSYPGLANPFDQTVDLYSLSLHAQSRTSVAHGDVVVDALPRAWASLTMCCHCFDYIGNGLQADIALARTASTVALGGLLAITSLREQHVEQLAAYGFDLAAVLASPRSAFHADKSRVTDDDIGIWRRDTQSPVLASDLARIDTALAQ